MFHKKVFQNAAGRPETRTVATRAVHLRDFPLRGVGKGVELTDGARMEDIAFLKAYTDALGDGLRAYIDQKGMGREKCVVLDAHTAFHEISAFEHVLTFTNCAPTTVLMPSSSETKVGDTFSVTGAGGTAGWQIALEDGQTVLMGRARTTEGKQGLVQSTTPATSVSLVCVSTDTTHGVFVVTRASTELVLV